ncbi:MAG: DNA polymerase III subunit gamma/tau, partial [Lentisphaeria bacterium]
MTYQVLARKCRPQRFSEIVGQEHITRTLQNAIEQDRLGHAYLLVGPRGIGKTTTARILAKALNCTNPQGTEPCCECESCRQIADGSSLDVMEIDGASHNKVEHVREIRENVQYAPTQGQYKVYSIDEVHMLTPAAWNALLKTLEEPPPHVKFFFATTEPHKVLATIVSRCQRLDLKRLTVPQISEHLRRIAEQESVRIEEKALNAIARAADGAMRDGQSIFDQIIAFCGKGDEAAITEENVINVFGLASSNELKSLAMSLISQEPETAVSVVHQLAERGRDLERMFGDLISFLRNIMIYQICSDPRKVLDVSDTELEDLEEVSSKAERSLIRGLLTNLLAEERRLRTTFNKRVYLEVALVKSMEAAASVQIDKVISDLKRLRQTRLPDDDNGNSENSRMNKTGDNNNDEPVSDLREYETESGQSNSLSTSQHPDTEQQVSSAEAIAEKGNGNEAEERGEDDQSAGSDAGKAELLAEGDDLFTSPTDISHEKVTSPESSTMPGDIPAEGREDSARQNAITGEINGYAGNTVEDADNPEMVHENEQVQGYENTESEHPGGEEDETAGGAYEIWHRLIEEIRKNPENQQLKIYMKEMKPLDFKENGNLQVAYDEEFSEEHVRFLSRSDNTRIINNAFQRLTGRKDAEVIIKKWKEGVSNGNRR